jgi:hypothetical protein
MGVYRESVTPSLSDVLAGVDAINDPSQPFTYAVEDGRIVGRWDIVKATSLYPTEIDHLDKKYRIEVTLDEGKHTYDFDEVKTSSGATLDGGGLSFGSEGFKGKSSSKEFSFELGGVNKTDDGVSMKPVVYSFETSRIKDPLFGYLQQHGWSRKKGFLSGLFNH